MSNGVISRDLELLYRAINDDANNEQFYKYLDNLDFDNAFIYLHNIRPQGVSNEVFKEIVEEFVDTDPSLKPWNNLIDFRLINFDNFDIIDNVNLKSASRTEPMRSAISFRDCKNLKEVTLPADLGEFYLNSLDGCENLETINIIGSNNPSDFKLLGFKLPTDNPNFKIKIKGNVRLLVSKNLINRTNLKNVIEREGK